MNPGQIICAKCGKPVDKVEWFDDFDTGGRVIRAFCHGEMDEMRLDSDVLTNMRIEEFNRLANAQGVAFREVVTLPANDGGQRTARPRWMKAPLVFGPLDRRVVGHL